MPGIPGSLGSTGPAGSPGRDRREGRDERKGEKGEVGEKAEGIKAEVIAHAAAFQTIAPKGMLVCAAAALNHYAINHTTGQGRLQGRYSNNAAV